MWTIRLVLFLGQSLGIGSCRKKRVGTIKRFLVIKALLLHVIPRPLTAIVRVVILGCYSLLLLSREYLEV